MDGRSKTLWAAITMVCLLTLGAAVLVSWLRVRSPNGTNEQRDHHTDGTAGHAATPRSHLDPTAPARTVGRRIHSMQPDILSPGSFGDARHGVLNAALGRQQNRVAPAASAGTGRSSDRRG